TARGRKVVIARSVTTAAAWLPGPVTASAIVPASPGGAPTSNAVPAPCGASRGSLTWARTSLYSNSRALRITTAAASEFTPGPHFPGHELLCIRLVSDGTPVGSLQHPGRSGQDSTRTAVLVKPKDLCQL